MNQTHRMVQETVRVRIRLGLGYQLGLEPIVEMMRDKTKV